MSAIWCLGSINVDMFYDVPHIPAPGETLSATAHDIGLGGKGANQSVAAARAGSTVHHIGAIGPSSDWIVERLEEYGVDTSFVRIGVEPTGHAIINGADTHDPTINPQSYGNLIIGVTITNLETGEILIDTLTFDVIKIDNV